MATRTGRCLRVVIAASAQTIAAATAPKASARVASPPGTVSSTMAGSRHARTAYAITIARACMMASIPGRSRRPGLLERDVTGNGRPRIVGAVTAPSAHAEQPVGDGRATRWHGHKARRRAEMIDAAVEVIEQHGVEISVQLIAEHLALPRPVVYRHIGGRAELDALARRRILELLLAELLPALQPNGTLKDAVRGAIGTYLDWIELHPNLHRFLGDAPQEGGASLSGAGREVGGQLADMFAATLARFGIDPARARPMAFGMVGLVDGVVASWRAEPEPVLGAEQIQGILTESVLSLFEGNARSLGVPLQRDSLVADLLVAPDAAPPPEARLR